MKKLLVILSLSAILTSCQTSDKEIRADITTKAKQDLDFSGLQYTVNKGVVSFTGRCPSEKAFSKIKRTVSNINVIKAVRYNVLISPVTLDSLTPVKQKVDSILAKYPQVIAELRPSSVTLKGVATVKERGDVIRELNSNNIKLILDSLNAR